MNEYEYFQNITNSIEQLLSEESQSLEIQLAARNLRKSVRPCLEEIRRCASKLKHLNQDCFRGLDMAEDVWNSKPRIAEAPKADIWEHLGEIGGQGIRIRQLGEQYRIKLIEEFTEDWEAQCTKFRKKWFAWDETKLQFKKNNIGLFEKDAMIKELRVELDREANNLVLNLSPNVNLIYREIISITSSSITDCINRLDRKNQNKSLAKIAEISHIIKSDNIYYVNKFQGNIKKTIDNLEQQSSMFGISLDNFNKFCETVLDVIKGLVIAIFDEKLQIALKTIEEVISFYNDFLEKQARYQQETPDQREAEKAWIDTNRQQLEQVQKGLEAILNPCAG